MYENKVEDILKAQSGNKEIMTKLVTENSNLISQNIIFCSRRVIGTRREI